MAERPNPVVFLIGLAAGIGGALFFRMTSAPPESEASIVAPAPAAEAASAPVVTPALPDEPEAREAAIRATRLPSELRYPIEAQYADAPRSDVPHQLIAAYDQSPGTTRGTRRLFILAVPPDTTTEALERLVTDLRTHHLDATALRIRVYDSVAAARFPAQAGVSTDPHLIASYSRDDKGATYEVHGKPAPL